MLEVIILAAGHGSRMQSSTAKVLHPLGGQPLVCHVLETARRLGAGRLHVVVGHDAESVTAAVTAPDVQCHLQPQQLGTGHAVQQAIDACHAASTVLVLFGDVPLIQADSLSEVVSVAASGLAMLAANLPDPAGYGRVLRDARGNFQGVVEERDASPDQKTLREINTGVLAAPAATLRQYLERLTNNNAQGEYYLPDVLKLAVAEEERVTVVASDNALDCLGVNTPQQLEQLERLYQGALADQLLSQGVSIADRSRLDIRGTLQCGSDVRIDVNTVFEGAVVLADGVAVGANCVLANSVIGEGAQIHPFTYIEGAVIKAGASIGPYARIRPGTVIDERAKVGNFVEIKNTHLGPGAKASHLAYLGDADVGSKSNVGAGTITCNYDGANKFRTVLGESVFVGSNSTLVAPVTIASGGFVAAGSTITEDVKADQLAVARGRQRNVDGWRRPSKPEETD
ncbi:MAG: bifunctional UDP-N-acetylglucosamine diphosphorylase/glucosamine-1-phosphate N-acetyltransferase GlmU [Luminiphilus sp.]